ncbi:hypothetical protein BDZ45DRAFT_673299 [Acephala macrosclerotiorum]|nr:hypothetical protein BDZ45DRAFT_673299 [Acephala macrosclerotiorum]
MSGAPGSGKSTLANLLTQSLNGIVINHDLLKSFLLEYDLGASFNQVAKLTYNLQWTLAEDVMKQGRTVIIDSTCNYEETLTQGTALAERYGYEYRYVECKVNDIDLLDQRLRGRVSLRSQRKGVDVPPPDASALSGPDFDYRAQYKNWMENPHRPICNAIVVDSTRGLQECLDYVLEQIVSVASSRAIPKFETPTSSEIPEVSVIVRAQESAVNLAVLGGTPAFPPSHPVPQILPSGYGYPGDYDAVHSIIRNEPSLKQMYLPSRQRFVVKDTNAQESYRASLQRRIADLLGLDTDTTAVLCLTSGTNALRAALKAVAADNRSEIRNEVIVPAITAVSTIHAVMMEGYTAIIVDVDPHSWMLSVTASAQAISERTAAIITVDWLGTLCDLGPFRKLADEYGVKLISDSAQSFGAIPGKPPAINLADATIYSTGFPKVFHTGGSGGILVCSASQAAWLEDEPTLILRHEVMSETNAFLGLRALDRLPQDLEARRKVAEMYRLLLSDVPGIVFQHVARSSGTTHYQLSVAIHTGSFGLDAKTLCWALQAENILSSSGRMPCLGVMPRLLRRCKTAGSLSVSQALGGSSLTLPISNLLTPEYCQIICARIKAIQKHSQKISTIKHSIIALSPPREQVKVVDIAGKFSEYWVVPVAADVKISAGGIVNSDPWTILVKWKDLAKRKISIDEVHRRVSSRSEWTHGDMVTNDLVVHEKLGQTGLVLSPRSEGYSRTTQEPFFLTESGSSASVTLVLCPSGQAEVHKTCSDEGIDGNGRPWLEKQVEFFESSDAVKSTNIFVKPLRHSVAKGTVSITFPYLPSHSLAEMALAGMGAEPLLLVLTDLFSEMAAFVWPKNTGPASDNYIEYAHFERMRRRVGIACAIVPRLGEVACYESITLNGRLLLGFDHVVKKLSCHPTIQRLAPKILGEFHGDLNLHNILCQLKPDAERPVVLIDPRGVPLLPQFAGLGTYEPGDYSYDISKLKFSLSGFSEIRKGFYSLRDEGESFELRMKVHPGSHTLAVADRDLFGTISGNEGLMKWIDAVEPSGLRSLELRVLLGEAAHFIADSACALGRGKGEEVLPLFLLGIEKLNNLLERIESESESFIGKPKPLAEMGAAIGSPNFGAAAIQSAILGSSGVTSAWDVLEILVKSESIQVAHQLLNELLGECLPEGTDVYMSTHPIERVKFPCVLIHPFVGVRGQTHAVLSGIRRTQAFLKDGGVSQERIDALKIVTVTSTGASERSQYVSRQNDKLLAPGPWGVSPLRLIVLGVNQLSFPHAGRWIVENDSVFVLSQSLRVGGDCLCLLASKRQTTSLNSPWRVCVNSTQEIDGRIFATSFRDIGPLDATALLLQPTSAIFIPKDLGQFLAGLGEDYAARLSPLLVDFVLPQSMQREHWVELCHSQGFGINSDLAWSNAENFTGLFPKIELADGGDRMLFHHFGSDFEYSTLVSQVNNDPLLASFAHLPSMAKWLRNYRAGRI